MFLLLGAGLAFVLLVPLVLRRRQPGRLVWLGAAAAAALVLGTAVQGFEQHQPACERAGLIFAARDEPAVMEDLARTFDMEVTSPRGTAPGGEVQISQDDDLVATAPAEPAEPSAAGAPVQDEDLTCEDGTDPRDG